MPCMAGGFEAAPDRLPLQFPGSLGHVLGPPLDAAAAALGGGVGKRANTPWSWRALARQTRQRMAWHGGKHSRQSAAPLWAKLPGAYRAPATCATEHAEAYKGVMPTAQHNALTTLARQSTPLARCNTT